MTTPQAHATKRQAGANVLHTVYDWYGNVAGQRRSAHSYDYAICKRTRLGEMTVVRWSRSNRTSGAEFALAVASS